MLYFAYGSNLHIEQMSKRCPAAKPNGRLRLPNAKLVFRSVADCIPAPGEVCYGGVWRITPACERVLDIYEGVASGMYNKEYIQIKRTREGDTEMLIYTMNSTGIMPPTAYYLNVIRQGYRDFAMPKAARALLRKAVADSHDDKAPTYREVMRRQRDGWPKLAPRPEIPDMPATGK